MIEYCELRMMSVTTVKQVIDDAAALTKRVSVSGVNLMTSNNNLTASAATLGAVAADLDTVRGYEGAAARAYYGYGDTANRSPVPCGGALTNVGWTDEARAAALAVRRAKEVVRRHREAPDDGLCGSRRRL